jgi:hypothetical protein
MINGEVLDAVFTIQTEGCWRLGVDTNRDLPEDMVSACDTQFFVAGQAVPMPSRSIKVLVREAAAHHTVPASS